MTFLKSLLRSIFSGKTATHRACSVSRADAARIMNISAYS
jgi:hypothetical protein|tara:strand:+ start:77540 stop:77659 length:120 start_codon:yes stop_codon:yes gene_type:complete